MPLPFTVEDIKTHLTGLTSWFEAAEDEGYDAARIESDMVGWIREFERKCRWRFLPVQVVCKPDGTYDTRDDLPVLRDSAYTYYNDDARAYFRIVTNERPVRTVQRIRLFLGSQLLTAAIPTDWIVVDENAGYLNLLPVSGAVQWAPSNTILFLLDKFVHESQGLPRTIALDYEAGLADGWEESMEWADALLAMQKWCAHQVLPKIAQVKAAGQKSLTVSADGLSQTYNYDRFADRRAELAADVEAWCETFKNDKRAFAMAGL